MKIINKVLFLLSFSIIITACNTTKKTIVEDFTVNLNSPQTTVGEIDLQLETLLGLGKLKKQTVTALFFPKEDVICLRYKFEYYTFNQFWNKKARALFISALQKYNEDYNARDLQKGNNKSQIKYGTFRSYLVWQQFSFTVQARANMNVDLGYTFKDKSPYFSVYQREAKYIDKDARDNNRTSPNLTMYFTRAQAAELAAIFEQYTTTNDMPEEYEEYEEFNIPQKKSDVPKDDY